MPENGHPEPDIAPQLTPLQQIRAHHFTALTAESGFEVAKVTDENELLVDIAVSLRMLISALPLEDGKKIVLP